MSAPDASPGAPAFRHRWDGPAAGTGYGTVVALHGTGGDEASLLPLLQRVAPRARVLGVRGRSDDEGVTRYFRRYDALRYDQAHLRSEAAALAAFVTDAVAANGSDAGRVVAVGYSNGANIALATALLHPGTFDGLALLRPVAALEAPPEPDLGDTAWLLHFGAHDPYEPAGRALPETLRRLGAEVRAVTLDAGHGLTPEDLAGLRAWYGPRFDRIGPAGDRDG